MVELAERTGHLDDDAGARPVRRLVARDRPRERDGDEPDRRAERSLDAERSLAVAVPVMSPVALLGELRGMRQVPPAERGRARDRAVLPGDLEEGTAARRDERRRHIIIVCERDRLPVEARERGERVRLGTQAGVEAVLGRLRDLLLDHEGGEAERAGEHEERAEGDARLDRELHGASGSQRR